MGEKSSIDEAPALTEKARVVALMEKERIALLLTCLPSGHTATTASHVSGYSSSEYALPCTTPPSAREEKAHLLFHESEKATPKHLI